MINVIYQTTRHVQENVHYGDSIHKTYTIDRSLPRLPNIVNVDVDYNVSSTQVKK